MFCFSLVFLYVFHFWASASFHWYILLWQGSNHLLHRVSKTWDVVVPDPFVLIAPSENFNIFSSVSTPQSARLVSSASGTPFYSILGYTLVTPDTSKLFSSSDASPPSPSLPVTQPTQTLSTSIKTTPHMLRERLQLLSLQFVISCTEKLVRISVTPQTCKSLHAAICYQLYMRFWQRRCSFGEETLLSTAGFCLKYMNLCKLSQFSKIRRAWCSFLMTAVVQEPKAVSGFILWRRF